ncbi:CopD family protein [Candidatus Phycosocius spiralis]|uniref:Protoporphyrinogen IX oxidase n=1 Tax=Candidatus Phycosocius spiralis TaxID=2815099 RepID=A0ABQ4PXA6_9PROT|nr:CopD family protein [Candidatus Phycosocius spiralis]GIU67643.1 membrane protein [Candidatus Phycosocius spiralis]
MSAWISAHYEVFRALHIIAVIAWMAGLMYLPRLFVYHSTAAPSGELDRQLIVMEGRLHRGIMIPAMLVVWLLGICLMVGREGFDLLAHTWMQIKLAMVTAITALDHLYLRWRKAFARGERPLNHVSFRFLNELPFVFMIIAVFMVVLEPFS